MSARLAALGRGYRVWLLLLVVAAVLRAGTIHRSVIDWDESLYALMARAICDGHLPYTTVFDNKPPGIYVLFAAGMTLVGDVVLALRGMATVAVSLTAYLIFRVALAMERSPRAALIAGVTYVVMTLGNGGLAANTELFFLVCTTGAMWCVWRVVRRPEQIWRSGLAAGALLALAFQIKYLVLFDVMAAGLLTAWARLPARDITVRRVAAAASSAAVVIGAPVVLLTVGVAWLYAANGDWQIWYDAQVAANFVNTAGTPLDVQRIAWGWTREFAADAPLWAMTGALAYRVLVSRDVSGVSGAAFVITWLICIVPAVLVTKLMWPHYFLHLYPLHCLALAIAVDQLRTLSVPRRRLVVVGLCMLALPGVGWYRLLLNADDIGRAARLLARGVVRPVDVPARVASYLRERMRPGDGLYVLDDQPVIYLLVGVTPPTRYPYPSHLSSAHFSRMAGVDTGAELTTIYGRRPRFVVRRVEPLPDTAPAFYGISDRELARGYVQRQRIGGTLVFERVGPER